MNVPGVAAGELVRGTWLRPAPLVSDTKAKIGMALKPTTMWRLLAPQSRDIDGILDGSGWQPPAIAPLH